MNEPMVLQLKKKHYEAMLEDVKSRAPLEACGLIAGWGSKAEKIYIITNILDSSTRFKMDPEEQLDAFNDMDSNDYELVAIYHSHPNGPTGPSKSDIAEFAYPGTQYLIWYRLGGGWECRSYEIGEHIVVEIPVCLLE